MLGKGTSAIFDLRELLRSKKEKLAPQEANILLSCESRSMRDFYAGALAGVTAGWAATWKVSSTPIRIYLLSVAGTSFALWLFVRSTYSCAEQILKLDGSILQKELANIVVTKYQNDPSLMQLISKHFYSERIFDDSTSNNPKLRWRYRNFFSNNVVHDHRTHYNDFHDKTQGNSHNDSYNNSQGDSENVTDSKRTNLKTKHIFIKDGPAIMAELDPLDSLFGYGASVEEILHPNTPNKLSGTHNWGHRRSHRRRRMRNHEDLSNSQHAAAV